MSASPKSSWLHEYLNRQEQYRFNNNSWTETYGLRITLPRQRRVWFLNTAVFWIPHPESKVQFVGPTWGPLGSCRPRMGLMLAPWTLLSGLALNSLSKHYTVTSSIWFHSPMKHIFLLSTFDTWLVYCPECGTSDLGLTASTPLLLWWDFFVYQFCFVIRSSHDFTHEPIA